MNKDAECSSVGKNSSASAMSTPINWKKYIRGSFRSLTRKSSAKDSLSGTCNIIESHNKIDFVNINTATEEELMTLPGISRSEAKSIVDYREEIGRFKRIEDIALVPGIGADKLEIIRSEICVKNRNVSCTSSLAQSYDSLGSSESPYRSLRINVNSASVFDLMAVHGMNQELAANVVEHRKRKGSFKSLDDLLKVKGMNTLKLRALHSQLSVDDACSLSVSDSERSRFLENGSLTSPSPVSFHSSVPLIVSNGRILGHKKSYSGSGYPDSLLAPKDLFELLCAFSQRPITRNGFDYKRDGRTACRVACWNLSNVSAEKIDNPGVREVICRTILENKFSVIAVQEVTDHSALKKICDELNFPVLTRVAEWSCNGKRWKFCFCNNCDNILQDTHGGLGYLYDSIHADLMNLEEISIPEWSCSSSLIGSLATFKVLDLQINLLNLHISGDKSIRNWNYLKRLMKTIDFKTSVLVVLGDVSESMVLDADSYQSCLVPRTCTNSSLGRQENFYTDNIYLNFIAQNMCTGECGYIRQGLSHLAIPHKWMWGGAASDHCPVWCEFYTDVKL